MDNNICTINLVCSDQIYWQTRANQKSEKSIWVVMRRLAGTIRDDTAEIFRYSNDPQPVFSNGGTRVLIRPDRIDLV